MHFYLCAILSRSGVTRQSEFSPLYKIAFMFDSPNLVRCYYNYRMQVVGGTQSTIVTFNDGLYVGFAVGNTLSIRKYTVDGAMLSMADFMCVDKVDRVEFSPDGVQHSR